MFLTSFTCKLTDFRIFSAYFVTTCNARQGNISSTKSYNLTVCDTPFSDTRQRTLIFVSCNFQIVVPLTVTMMAILMWTRVPARAQQILDFMLEPLVHVSSRVFVITIYTHVHAEFS